MTVLRGGTVVDGTGARSRQADVAFNDGRITAIAEPGVTASDGDDIDVVGLIVSPGFVDCHTHYDAQVLWDPDLSPSSWHGVTSVVIGNCGFGIAPTSESGREAIARTLENVEGMSFDALSSGIPWTFETFPEYLDAVQASEPRLNVAVMIGHTPLRLYVMGPDATDREATTAEVAAMRELVLDALDHGAVGFATSRQPAHAGAWGKPVPSRLASHAELNALASALGERDQGLVAITRGPDFGVAEISALSKSVGRPVTWTALMATLGGPDPIAVLDRTEALGGQVWPQVASRPVVLLTTLAEPAPLARVGAFAEVLSVAVDKRAEFYGDETWRARARVAMRTEWPGIWARTFVAETRSAHALVDGPSLEDIGRLRGADPLDVMCDLALDDELTTRFRVVVANDDDERIAELLNDPRSLLGLSDAGAHANQLCDAVFATHILEHWVRETGSISLEMAIRKMTSEPADLFGLTGRGRIAPGYAADLVVFDADQVGVEPMRRVWDLPSGADRLVAASRGIHGVWVNGIRTQTIDGPTDYRPGAVLRGAAATPAVRPM